ncbi:MAG: phosphotransferase family protein [Actinomycetota bacterium]|nr:phosphotransferase family protein [Actinomycetota bacterium]
MEGIREPQTSLWISEQLPDLQPPFSYELIAGGRSNLTFAVDDANGQRIVLRRPPVSHVLPTAHDMRREYRIISALHPLGFPVATPLAICMEPEVNDYPFYLMSYVRGSILRDPELTQAHFPDPPMRRQIAENLVSTLVTLHGYDVEKIGLADLARHDGYIERQLRRWYTQFQASSAEIDHRVPLVDEMFAKLSERIPAQQRTSVVHADYRLDNTMVADDGSIAAVLDWELCTLGDPLADIGTLLVYWTDPEDANVPLSAVTALPGFPRRAEVAEMYAEAAGVDLGRINYFMAFAYWRLACILEGVYSRYVQGARGGDRSSITDYARQVELLAESSREALSRY